MGLEVNLAEARVVGPSLVLNHEVAALVVIVHLEGEDCLLHSVNPVPVSKHCIEFPPKDNPVSHDPRRRLLDKEVAEPVRGGALMEG